MAKLFVTVFLATIIVAVQCDFSRKCYFCIQECETSKAAEKTCGATIGSSHDAVCTTRTPKDSKTPGVAQRKCEVIQKGNKITCEANQICTQCSTDLCNTASSISSNAAIMALLFTFFGARYLIH